jgi:TRAP-type C4-dicarboxylate transport system permease small subunit
LLTINFVSRFAQRPMHFFGALGSLIFFAGFVIAAYLAYAKFFMAVYKMTDRPLFYFGLLAMVLGTMLFLTGFIADIIVRNSPSRGVYNIKNKIKIKNTVE